MTNKKMTITFYPVGNGDTSLIRNDDGKHLLIDYNNISEAESDNDDRIFLEDEINEKLKGVNLDVLMITHAHDDHYRGFSDFFWLNCTEKYQSNERKKVVELWVPDAIIWDTGLKGEEELLRREARFRLLDEKKGIIVFGESDSLKEFINDSGKATYNEVKHLIKKPGETISKFSGFDIFIHSPHSWVTENEENKNNKCIVIQIDFRIDSGSVTKVIFGSDAESNAWDSIYTSTKNNNNLDKIEFDVFKLSHHCSYTALNMDEKGDQITEPTKNIKKIFEEHGNDKCKLIASCNPIPSKEDREDSGPPHYQAAEYYRKIRDEKGGNFEVTMQQPRGTRNINPVIIEITKYGPRFDKLAAMGTIGSGRITQTKSERQG
ncbi:MAG: hypothetical protein Q7J27_03060 [Syntrophales bacterium]|nr:hypothetical protein [Syntrophales bacterium]